MPSPTVLATRIALALLGLAVACGRAPEEGGPNAAVDDAWRSFPWITPLEERQPALDLAPVPFLPEERRAAYVPGVRWSVRQVPLLGPPMTAVREVLSVDAEGVMLRIHFEDDEGRIDEDLGVSEHRSPWKRLLTLQEWPLDRVRITRETITVPAGTFDCLRYDVDHATGPSETFWYAAAFPLRAVRQEIGFGRKRSPFELVGYHIP